MPSTPRFHAIPHCAIQVWNDRNWKPASAVSKPASRETVSASSATVMATATGRSSSGRDLGISATTSAPRAGSTMMAVRSGKPFMT